MRIIQFMDAASALPEIEGMKMTQVIKFGVLRVAAKDGVVVFSSPVGTPAYANGNWRQHVRLPEKDARCISCAA